MPFSFEAFAITAAVVGFGVPAFLVGSIPFGYLLGRFAFRTDVRRAGSGNIGAANVARTCGRGAGALVFALDALKGALPTFALLELSRHADAFYARYAPSAGASDVRLHVAAAVVGIAAVLGHCFSPWLGFRGGKGVATAIGAIAAFSPFAGGLAVAIWALGAKATGYSSVGSLAAVAVAPVALAVTTHDAAAVAFGVACAALVAWTHRANIVRLAAGEENRLRGAR